MSASSLFALAALFVGALIPLQVAFNAQLGGVTKNPYAAGLLVFMIGAGVMTVVAALMRAPLPPLAELRSAPPTIWLGGMIAAFYVLSAVILTPKLGVGTMTIFILAGQIFMALLLDHLGAFGNPVQSLNIWRIVGGTMVLGGAVLIRTH
ncbi:MAG: DMT family transporter [Alphaproteobacteria bacterium]